MSASVEVQVVFCPDGSVKMEVLDQPGVSADQAGPSELQRRLAHPEVGRALAPTLGAVRALIGHLIADDEVADDVRYTLALMDQLAQHALAMGVLDAAVPIAESEYRTKVLLAQRIVAGDSKLEHGRVFAGEAEMQRAVVDTVKAAARAYAEAPDDEKPAVLERVAEAVFWLTGHRAPHQQIHEALVVAPRKGRPRGAKNGARPVRSKYEVFKDLLAGIGIKPTSSDALMRLLNRPQKR